MALGPDDTVCYCFHVPLRKIESFCRNTRPRYPSQISECLSAGTGCGWCRRLLEHIHRRTCGTDEPWWRKTDDQPAPSEPTSADDYPTPEAYAAARQAYLKQKH